MITKLYAVHLILLFKLKNLTWRELNVYAEQMIYTHCTYNFIHTLYIVAYVIFKSSITLDEYAWFLFKDKKLRVSQTLSAGVVDSW